MTPCISVLKVLLPNVIMTPNCYLCKPHVLMEVEELSGVTDMKHWASVKVGVIGTLKGPSALVSVCEQGGPYNIAVKKSKSIPITGLDRLCGFQEVRLG